MNFTVFLIRTVRNFIFPIHPSLDFIHSSWDNRKIFNSGFCYQNIVFDSVKKYKLEKKLRKKYQNF